jgi:hypothetical protein
MRTKPVLSAVPLWVLLPLAALAAGCSGGSARPPFTSEENLRLIGVAYQQASAKVGHPPHDVEELKPTLKRYGDPETLLVSPGDGKPFTIRWGTPALRPGPGGTRPVLAYESDGVEGKKYVLDNMLAVKQMTDAELGQALQAKP